MQNTFDFDYADDDIPMSSNDENLIQSWNKQLDQLTNISLKIAKRNCNSNDEQVGTLVASVKVEHQSDYERPGIDLVCVIDRSGSMHGSKIELVKHALKCLVELLTNKDRISVIIFNQESERLFPLQEVITKKTNIISAIEAVQASGGTNIALGIKHALNILAQRRHFNPITSIFLLSDGLDSKARSKVQDLIQAVRPKGTYTIHSFGFGMDHDSSLMTDIADMKSGNFYFIKEASDTLQNFTDCIGELFSVVGKNLQIKISPNVEVIKAYGEENLWRKEDESFSTSSTYMMLGKQRNYVFDVKLPKDEKPQTESDLLKIATVEAVVKNFEGKEFSKKAVLGINQSQEIKNNLQPENEKEVLIQYFRVRLDETLKKAQVSAENGDYNAANKVLNNFKEELKLSMISSEKEIVNMIKDVDQAIQDIQPQVYDTHGKHNLIGNARAQLIESSYPQSANRYSNQIQQELALKTAEMVKNSKIIEEKSLGSVKQIKPFSNLIQISSKRDTGFYVFLGKLFLIDFEEIEFHACSDAIGILVKVSELLCRYDYTNLLRIETKTIQPIHVDPDIKRGKKIKLIVRLGRSSNFPTLIKNFRIQKS